MIDRVRLFVWGHATRRRALLLTALCASGCFRPAEERARKDVEVGQATAAGVRLSVANGYAAVRSLESERAELWENAPALSIGLRFDAPPPERFTLVVQNCMRAAQATVSGATLVELARERGACRLELTLDASDVDVELAPPEAAAAVPFRFAVLSDIQEAIDEIQDVYDRINALPDLEFVLGAGDLTERGTVAELERFQDYMLGLDYPYYVTLGNHELGENPPRYHDYFGRGSSSFEYRGVRFTLLDSASATLDPIVYGWLDEWLALGQNQLHLVAMHIAPLDPIGVRNGAFASRAEAAKLLRRLAANGVDLTLYGHIHSFYSFDNAGIPAYISGGGGAIPEKFDNIGRHFLVIDVDPTTSAFSTSIVRVD
jgi:3',5'-cyclic-AMP phosphodiesterase